MIDRSSTHTAVKAAALTQYHKKLLSINFYNSLYPSSRSSHTTAEMKGLFFWWSRSDIPQLSIADMVMLSNLSSDI